MDKDNFSSRINDGLPQMQLGRGEGALRKGEGGCRS